MRTLKSLSDIANLRDLRSISRTRRSAKPQLSTTAILELSMARNERDHLVKEKMKLEKRKAQINKRLPEIEKEMDVLLEQARKKAAEIRGGERAPEDISESVNVKKEKSGRAKMVIEY